LSSPGISVVVITSFFGHARDVVLNVPDSVISSGPLSVSVAFTCSLLYVPQVNASITSPTSEPFPFTPSSSFQGAPSTVTCSPKRAGAEFVGALIVDLDFGTQHAVATEGLVQRWEEEVDAVEAIELARRRRLDRGVLGIGDVEDLR
jgi:hypothetical protein